MKIAFIGIGNVGSALADHLARLGHSVTIAGRDARSESVRKAAAKNSSLVVRPLKEAVAEAEVVFLATPFQANEEALKAVASELKGRILVDCTNPVGPGLTHGLKNEISGSEFVRNLVPQPKVVKAFAIYGLENFENSAYPGYNVKPVMMYWGHDAAAKKTVNELIAQLGWEPLDVGGLEQALHLEHMTLLWVRMVRVNGHSPNIVWAVLKR
jgi:predicted dinucleotide-binding enzyme